MLFLLEALRSRLAQRIEFFFEIGLNLERRIPPPFELGRDEPVRGVDRIVLALRPGNLVARLIDGKRFLPDPVIIHAAMHLESCHSSLDAERPQATEHLLGHRVISSQAIDAHAAYAVRI